MKIFASEIPRAAHRRRSAMNSSLPLPSQRRSFRSGALPEILTLDPVADHQRIVFLSTRCDFPFDTTRALEFALLRTFGVPSVAMLLARTGEFTERTQKRYDDTDLIVSGMMEHGYDSARGAAALQRMNEIHGRFQIANADFLYVLSTFIFEPIRWNERFGWRRLHEVERLAYFRFWREVGLRMHIREIPADYAEFERYNREFEATRFRFSEGGKRVATATLGMFARWFPWPLKLAVQPIMRALIEPRLAEALGLPVSPRWLRQSAATTLRWRGRIAHALTWRHGAVLRSEQRHRSYPCGVTIEQVVPAPQAHP